MAYEPLVQIPWEVALPLAAILVICGLWVRAYSNRRRMMSRRRF